MGIGTGLIVVGVLLLAYEAYEWISSPKSMIFETFFDSLLGFPPTLAIGAGFIALGVFLII